MFAIVMGLAVVGNGESFKLTTNPEDILRCVLFIDNSIPYKTNHTIVVVFNTIQYVVMITLTSSNSTDGKHTYCILPVFAHAQI